MRILGVHHIALQVSDLEKMAQFYCGVLGLPEAVRHHKDDGQLRSIWVRLSTRPGEPAFLALEKNSLPQKTMEHRGYSLLAITIESEARRATEEALRARGVVIEHTSRWTVYFRDPEGNRVGLSHYPDDPP